MDIIFKIVDKTANLCGCILYLQKKKTVAAKQLKGEIFCIFESEEGEISLIKSRIILKIHYWIKRFNFRNLKSLESFDLTSSFPTRIITYGNFT